MRQLLSSEVSLGDGGCSAELVDDVEKNDTYECQAHWTGWNYQWW